MPKSKKAPLDLLIIGGSAAGMSAAIYAARRRLKFEIVSVDIGGEVATSGEIDNYPGIPMTSGFELTKAFREHLQNYDIVPKEGVKVTSIVKKGKQFIVQAKQNTREKIYRASAVLVATGVRPRKLGVSGEEEFEGKGVTYCTTCDGPLFTKKTTVTIGGGNSALESALMMSGIAKKHYILNINPQLGGDKILIEKVRKLKNVEVIQNAETQQILGDTFVTGVEYKDKKTEKVKTIDAQGVFIHIGWVPNSGIVPKKVKKNQKGEIITDHIGRTNVPGLYAAGDVDHTPYKQIGIAVGEGIAAMLAAEEHINKL